MKQWYIVQAQTNMEKKVQSLINEKIARSNFIDMFGDILVPEEQVSALKNGKNTLTTRKFYPGYVFVNMEFTDDTWHLIKSTPSVIGFIGGTKTKPSPLSQKEMDKILQKVETSKEKPVPKQTFEIGELVRITNGPFKDFEGMVEYVNYNHEKVKISISVFGRATPTDFDFTQVIKKE